MNDEEVAFRIVRLYFEEIARLGFKRQLDLDQIMNAYFYTLKKIRNKDSAMKKITEDVYNSKKIVTQTTTQTYSNDNEKTSISTEKNVTDILEK
ncbi:MAG: hypothetical protein PHX27_02290 [Candidatus ainarchaeum sp.]|nr:hypothetical protein [Candidatus ainarchaeum sp.]